MKHIKGGKTLIEQMSSLLEENHVRFSYTWTEADVRIWMEVGPFIQMWAIPRASLWRQDECLDSIKHIIDHMKSLERDAGGRWRYTSNEFVTRCTV